MNTHPKNALKILQLLLRCGMVSQEELNVVLEMMPAVHDSQAVAAKEPESQSRQNTLILEFD